MKNQMVEALIFNHFIFQLQLTYSIILVSGEHLND